MFRKLLALAIVVYLAVPFAAKADAIGSIQTDLYISMDSNEYYGWNTVSQYTLTDFYFNTASIYPSPISFSDTSGVLGINTEPARIFNASFPPGSSVQSEYIASPAVGTDYLYLVSATSTVTADTGNGNRIAYVFGQQSLTLYFPVVEAGNPLDLYLSLSTVLTNLSAAEGGFQRLVWGDYWSADIGAGYFDADDNYLGHGYLWSFNSGSGAYLLPGDSAFCDYGGPLAIRFDPAAELQGAATGYYMFTYNVSDKVQEMNWDPKSPASVVPEPSSILLFGSGFAGIVLLVRRKRN